MKRQYDGKIIVSKSIKKKVEWSQEEDEFLRNLVSTAKRKNWTTISKKMNKNFKFKKRTTEECKTRFNFISQNNDKKEWSKSEELVFLFVLHFHGENWEDQIEKVIDRKSENIKAYLISQVKYTISQVKSMDEERFKSLNSTEQLKFLVYFHLLLNNSEEYLRMEEGIREEDFISCSRRIGFKTKQDLTISINNIIERLQNKILAKLKAKPIGKKSVFEELFHKRPEEYARDNICMHILPSSGPNRDHVLIAIYFLPDN